jgi:anti-sigma B factor antagonist
VTEDVFGFETEERGGSAIVRLIGELDLAAVEPLQHELDRVCADGPAALTVDLSELDFVDSSGLHLLMRLRGVCQSRQLSLRLVPGPPAVQRLFLITGTDTQFTFVDELPRAASAVDNARARPG